MNTIFRSYLRKFVLVFFDGILIYSRNLEEHLQHLEIVLEILRKNELYANRKKCKFCSLESRIIGPHHFRKRSGGSGPEKNQGNQAVTDSHQCERSQRISRTNRIL